MQDLVCPRHMETRIGKSDVVGVRLYSHLLVNCQTFTHPRNKHVLGTHRLSLSQVQGRSTGKELGYTVSAFREHPV